MKKFICTALTLLMLCLPVSAKDYIQMTAPDGAEVSVYKTAVEEYAKMGYYAGENEMESVWTSGTVTEYTDCKRISNGRLRYEIKDGYITETDLTTENERQLMKLNSGSYEYWLVCVYDKKLYFCEHHLVGMRDSFDTETRTYSYNTETGECIPENLNMAGFFDADVGTVVAAYGDKVFFLTGQGVGGDLRCFDLAANSYFNLSDSCSCFVLRNNGLLFYTDSKAYDSEPTVRCFNVNTYADSLVCSLGHSSMYVYTDILTDTFVTYRVINGDGTVNAYIRYYNEAEPRWIMTGKSIEFLTDEQDSVLLLDKISDSVYRYTNGVLEYVSTVSYN